MTDKIFEGYRQVFRSTTTQGSDTASTRSLQRVVTTYRLGLHDTHAAPQRMHSFQTGHTDIQHVQDEALDIDKDEVMNGNILQIPLNTGATLIVNKEILYSFYNILNININVNLQSVRRYGFLQISSRHSSGMRPWQ